MVNGWKTKKLGDVAEVCMCKRIFAGQTSKTGNIPFYKIGTFGREADAYISSQLYEEYKTKYSYPEKGDVLISAAGTLGRTVVFDGRPAYFQDSNIVWLRIDKSQLCNDYLAQYYNVIKWASSEGSTISRLYNGIICDTEILIPPLEEQTVIARALSDADCLISSLKKLIAKKKAIKQGAMQELLTGKKRLPGFSGEWKKYKVREIGAIVTGSTPPRSNRNLWGGNFPWVNARDFIGKYISFSCEHITSEGKNYCRILPAGSVLITCIASIGLNGIAATPLATNQQINAIVCNHDFYNEIVYYSLTCNKERLKLMAGETAVPIISKQQFKEFEILLPQNILEQKAIAKVLSDMDSEIEQLEKKLSKYKQIKQGMMQELLTGRIRLV